MIYKKFTGEQRQEIYDKFKQNYDLKTDRQTATELGLSWTAFGNAKTTNWFKRKLIFDIWDFFIDYDLPFGHTFIGYEFDEVMKRKRPKVDDRTLQFYRWEYSRHLMWLDETNAYQYALIKFEQRKQFKIRDKMFEEIEQKQKKIEQDQVPTDLVQWIID